MPHKFIADTVGINPFIVTISSVPYIGLFVFDPSWLTALIGGVFLCLSTLGVKAIDIVYREYVRRKEKRNK